MVGGTRYSIKTPQRQQTAFRFKWRTNENAVISESPLNDSVILVLAGCYYARGGGREGERGYEATRRRARR